MSEHHDFEFAEEFGACFWCIKPKDHHNHTGNELRLNRFLYDGCDPQPRCHCDTCEHIRQVRETA